MKHFSVFCIAALMSATVFAQWWEPQVSPTTQNLNAVVFVDTSHGWAVGDSGRIIHTSGGGDTWTFQGSGTTLGLNAVTFVDASHGWAVGECGEIIHTTNGGSTWTFQSSDTGYSLQDVKFVDANNGWAVGEVNWFQGMILHTSDGGGSWVVQSGDTVYPLYGVDFVDADRGWTVGRTGKIFSTTNHGINWALQFDADFDATGGGGALYDVDFSDADHGWAVGYHAGEFDGINHKCIFHTTDGGVTWVNQLDECGRLNSVSFVDNGEGWVAGDTDCGGGGSLDDPVNALHTTNGGATWMQQSVASALQGVYFIDADHGWAVGNSGTIMKYSPLPPCPLTPLPFMCHFDSLSLDPGWFWIREDTTLWSLTDTSGCMSILADGDLTWGSNDAKNILLRRVSNEDVRLETKLNFDPPYELVLGAGLVIYHDDDNYVNIQRQADHIRSHSEQNGEVAWSDLGQLWNPTYLRLEKTGDVCRSYASPDGVDWTPVALWTGDWTWGSDIWLGVLSVGYNDPPVRADFDYVRIDSLSAGPHPQPDTLWTRTYGGSADDVARSVQQTSDGGYILAGTTSSFGAGCEDFYVLKTNAQGDTVWTRTYGGSNDDEGFSVQETFDGGFIAAGVTYSFGPGTPTYGNIYLVKTNEIGDTIWTRTLGGSDHEWVFSVQQTADGGYIMAGITCSFGAGQRDIYLVRWDAEGDTLWTRTYGAGADDEGWEVRQLPDGGYIIACTTRSYGAGNWDYYLVRTDGDGSVLWTRTYGGGAGDGGRCVEQTSDGGFIFGGWSCSFGQDYQGYVVKTDAEGYLTWETNFGGWSWDVSEWVTQISDGAFISVGGTTSFGDGNSDVYLAKIDSLGDVLWTETYGGPEEDRGWSVDSTSDGGCIIAGQTGSYGEGGADIWLLKLAPEQTTSADVPHIPLAEILILRQNFPNPFNASTTITYDMAKAAHVSLRVFDLIGREVAVLKDGMTEAGTHRVMFDGSNLASGIYFARLDAGTFVQTRKLMLLK